MSATPEQVEELRRIHDQDPLRFAADCTNEGWSLVTGNCGGCGDDCHPGQHCPPGEEPCTLCPEDRP